MNQGLKRSNQGNGVAPSPTPWCSSYWKESLQVTLDYGHQLYFLYIYIYIYIYNIVIHRQTVSFYQNSSVWLDTQDARSRDRNPSNFTLDLSFKHIHIHTHTHKLSVLNIFVHPWNIPIHRNEQTTIRKFIMVIIRGGWCHVVKQLLF